LSYYKP